ncbi:MAG TPA: magnesium transporter [Actinobacteria bacterium]|nr:magnesium transporter [Actinomycetota bacterium]
MRLKFLRPRIVADGLRDLARRKPAEAEEYFAQHTGEWTALASTNPHNAADILEVLTEPFAATLLQRLAPEVAGEVLNEMNPEASANLIPELSTDVAAGLIQSMTPDQAADILGLLNDEIQTDLLTRLDTAEKAAIVDLLRHAPDSAGGLMTTDVVSLPVGITAGEAIESLRRFHEELGNNLMYVYAVDADGRLRGVVSFRELFFARPGTGLDEVMVENPISVSTTTDREVVSELVQRYRLLAIPVVDSQHRLVGMVKIDEALEAVQAEATEDIAAMVGAGTEETVFTPVNTSVRRRFPWILVNLLIGMVEAVVILQFGGVIEDNVRIAAYMPLTALLAGNAGAQSLAVIIRAMSVGDLPPGRALRAVRREFIVGALNGILIAVVIGAGSALLFGMQTAAVFFIAILAAFFAAGFAGAGIPVLLRRLGLDPALASNIFLTMVTDIVGMGGFLAVAAVLL